MRLLHTRLLIVALLSISSATFALPAQALDLLGAIRLAAVNDPNLAAVQAQRLAAGQSTIIARSALLPHLGAEASYNSINLNSQTAVPGKLEYTQTVWGARLTQPLFHWDAWYQYKAISAQRSQQEAEADSRTQDLFLGVANAYFDVLRAQDTLALAQAQETALSRQREKADAQFKVGVIARADVVEADAQRDTATAERLSAEIGLTHARETLNAALATDVDDLSPLPENIPTPTPIPNDPKAWAELAKQHNPGLLAARFAATAAVKAKEAQRAGFLPSVDLYASTGNIRNSDITPATPVGTISPINFQAGRQTAVGVEARWELFAGGRTLALVKQAGYQADAARAQAMAQEHQIVNATRTAFMTVKT
ncbi:MAG: TolC family outer membrane protein, partial [Paraperlucidibaca sp.]